MSFKHPEILYALFALLIPVVIHLFQLQRFVKISFTNVKFLKEIELQTRKSSRLKKLLVLASRMLAFAMLIFAFAEPYFTENNRSKEQETVVYIDNSLSMQSSSGQTDLLQQIRQQIVEHLPQKGNFTLVTNDNVLSDLDRETFKEQVLAIQPTSVPFDAQQKLINLKPRLQHPEKNIRLLWFSDFQQTSLNESFPDFSHLNADVVQINNEFTLNIAIDSVYESTKTENAKELVILLKNSGQAVENVGVNAVQNSIVLSKTQVSLAQDQEKEVTLRITGNPTNVKIQVDIKDAFQFDNEYVVVFPKTDKIPVLVVSSKPSFFNRIYTQDEFLVTQKSIVQLSTPDFEKNHFVVLNEPETIPQNLIPTLQQFVENGGALCFIPHPKADIQNVNTLFQSLAIGILSPTKSDSLLVNTIHFSHPLLRNVFKKEVKNFQYPTVRSAYSGQFSLEQPILSLSNNQAFVSQFNVKKGQVYWIASSLAPTESNFINSPLVVPIFYNMAIRSGLPQQLAYRIGNENSIKVHVTLQKDQVITLESEAERFIPEQQIYQDFVTLQTTDKPSKSGFYTILFRDKNIGNIAFNTPKNESNLKFWNVQEQVQHQKEVRYSNQAKLVLQNWLSGDNEKNYFRWFVFLALFFVLLEIALIKYF